MKQVCPTGPTTKGIDIYHGDYIDDINAVIASGIEYAYLKAWEKAIDPSFKSRRLALKKAGLIVGAYDFFHPGQDPIAQADGFLATFGGILDAGDLPCALDFEVTDGIGRTTLLNNAIKWLEHVEAKTKVRPVLYMSPGFTELDSRFSKYPLWVANYGVSCPHVPDAHQSWTFWQGAESGKVPGMRGACDTDVFNGSLGDLHAFIQGSRVA